MECEIKFAPLVNRKGCSVMGILFASYAVRWLDVLHIWIIVFKMEKFCIYYFFSYLSTRNKF